MPAEDFARHPDEIARLHTAGALALQIGAVVAVADEADVLTLLPAARGQAEGKRQLADLPFRLIAEREMRPRKLRLREHIEHIALVLRLVGRAAQQIRSVRRALPADVVAGGDTAEALRKRIVEEKAEFQTTITVYAGIGRFAAEIAVQKRLDHLVPKRPLKRKHRKGDAQFGGGPRGGGKLGVRAVLQPHHRARDRITRVQQQPDGDGAVHPAAHRDQQPLSQGGSSRRCSGAPAPAFPPAA